MVHQIIKSKFIYIAIIALAFLNSCYYDNAEDLYPQPPDCDTTNVTYTDVVFPVIKNNCTGCHSGSVPAGNIALENYDQIVASAQSGSLLGTIRHDNGWSPMPKNGNKLDDCAIKKLEKWVADGSPNN